MEKSLNNWKSPKEELNNNYNLKNSKGFLIVF